MKVAVWCRHKDDNIIGIGPEIPWRISSDFKRFRRITEEQYLVAGERTYESFPNRTLPNRKIMVLTFNANYEVSDKENHSIVTDIKKFKDFDKDLYIVGGASIYKAFMSDSAKLMPDVIVDSMYCGELNPELKGEPVDISLCINTMNKDYRKISKDYELDNVITSVWVKKDSFIEQSTLKHIVSAIEAI